MGDGYVRSVLKVLTWLITWAGEVLCWGLIRLTLQAGPKGVSLMEAKHIWICEGQWRILFGSEFWTLAPHFYSRCMIGTSLYFRFSLLSFMKHLVHIGENQNKSYYFLSGYLSELY